MSKKKMTIEVDPKLHKKFKAATKKKKKTLSARIRELMAADVAV